MSAGTTLPAPVLRGLESRGVRLGRRLPGGPESVSFHGTYRNQPVLVTVRISDEPAAVASRTLERCLRRMSEDGQCPLPLPPAVYLDERISVTSITQQPGERATVTAAALRDLLDRLDRLHAVQVPDALRTPPPPVSDLLETFLGHGILRPSSAAAIRGVLGVKARQRLEFGDLRTAALRFNTTALTSVSGPLRLQYRLAGCDWAYLHQRWAGRYPWLAQELIDRADRAGLAATYACVHLLTACQQWTLARRPERQQHARRQIDAAQERLYRLYEAFQ